MTTALRVLHFADAHIDIANFGRHDPDSALPVRVMDFLAALDQIIDTALAEPVDLVIFAGDAYKDRNPHPTFQREWGKRMMRLSQAQIPTLLLVGNHDVSPASGRAHTLQEFNTLAVPHIYVADRIRLWTAAELGIPAQIITVPWVSRSQLMTREDTAGQSLGEILSGIETRVTKAIQNCIEQADPDTPLILTAHASVEGASYGSERTVMLGHELILGGRIVGDPRLDYVALGHIHKHQELTSMGDHPPVVYPGSIERIDFGEAKEKKGFVLADIAKGKSEWRFVPLKTRQFWDFSPDTPQAETFMQDIFSQLPQPNDLGDAVCRLRLTYPVEWEPLVDERALQAYFSEAFSLQLHKNRLSERRARLGDTVSVESLAPIDLLDIYWRSENVADEEIQALTALALEVLDDSGEVS